MNIRGRLQKLLTARKWHVAPLAILATSILSTSRSLTDQHFDIALSGTRWIQDDAILYAQAWSHHMPQTLYFGYAYNRFLSGGVWAFVFELALAGTLYALVLAIVHMILPKQKSAANALLLLFVATLCIPGVWPHGLSDPKLATIFSCVMLYGYLAWRKSKKSYWLFGETSKNWRYLLLSGCGLALLAGTTPFGILLALPLVGDLCIRICKDWHSRIRWTLFYIVPLLAQLWILLSILSSHRLFGYYWQSLLASIGMALHGTPFGGTEMPLVIIGAVTVLICLLHSERRGFTKARGLWLYSIIMLAVIVFFPRLFVSYAALYVVLVGITYRTEHSLRLVSPNIIYVCSLAVLMLSTPLRMVVSRKAELLNAKSDLAVAYVMQRQIESNTVLYYGAGAGIYARSAEKPATRFYDITALAYDNPAQDLQSYFRGDGEAEAATFLIYATDPDMVAPQLPRLEQYVSRHYQKAATLDGFDVYKRIAN